MVPPSCRSVNVMSSTTDTDEFSPCSTSLSNGTRVRTVYVSCVSRPRNTEVIAYTDPTSPVPSTSRHCGVFGSHPVTVRKSAR